MLIKHFSWIFRKKFSKEDNGEFIKRTAEEYLTQKNSDGQKSHYRHFIGIGFFIFGKICKTNLQSLFGIDGVQMLYKFDCFKESGKKNPVVY